MSKTEDDKIEAASKTIEPLPSQDLVCPARRIRRINVPVSEGGYDVIDGAVRLHLAMTAASLIVRGKITSEEFGQALEAICRTWNEAAVSRLSGKGGTS